MKKALSVLLSLAICFSLFAATGLFGIAAEVMSAADTADTGETGETGGITQHGLAYTVLEDGTLEVTGYTGSTRVVTIPYKINGKQVASIADSAFENNTYINMLQAYDLVKIGKWAFKGCTNLAAVSLNEGVEIIGEGAFEMTTSLTDIAFPSTVKEIGVWSFADSAISTIAFNNCNAQILRKAFFRCNNLTTVNIPKTVTYLGDNVFAECAKLSSINVEGHGPSCGVTPYGSVTPVFTDTQHPLCALECTHEGEHGNVAFTPWTDSTSLPTESGCYALSGDVTLSKTYYTPAQLTLCLNGYTVSNSTGGRIMTVSENAVVNICDCRENPGRFLGGTSEYSGAIYVYHATLNIYNGIFGGCNLTDRSGDGGALYLFESTVNMYGGEITGNTVAGDGAGVYAIKSSFNMYGGSIHGNTAYSGGAILVALGAANIYGGEIHENTATYQGGAIYIGEGDTLNLAGGVIRSNRADVGGAVYAGRSSSIILAGGAVNNNTADSYGGGIYVPDNASVEISGDPKIYDNTDSNGTTDLRLSNSVTVGVGELQEGAYLSVSLISGDSGIVTEGGAEYADYFISAFPENVHIVTDRLGNIGIANHSYEKVVYPDNATDESGTAYYCVCVCGKTDGSTFAPHGSHASCGEFCTHLGAHGSAEFQIWDSESTLPSTPGSYYLNHSVFLESTWEITSGEYIICLNGRNIDARTMESGSIISIASGAKLTLCNCQTGGGELFGGKGYDGGAIYNCGELGIFKLIIRDNTAANDGGGIYNAGTVEIYDSEIKNNSAGQRGGSIYSDATESVLKLYNVKVIGGTAGNASGGIRSGGTLYMKGGEISGNTGPFGAGIGIYGSAEIDSVTISSNNSHNVSGAIDNNGTLKLLNCRFSDNYSLYGGAIYNSGNLQIDNCSFVSNSSERGGAIHQSSEAIIKNSVFESNTASVRGGAIYNSGVMELINSTVSSNSAAEGAGIYLQESSEALIADNSVISGNTASGGNGDIYMNTSLKLTVSNLKTPFVAYVDRNTEESSVKILGGAEYKDYFISVADSNYYHIAVIGDDLDFNVHFYEYFINEETRYIKEDSDGEFYYKSCICGRISEAFFEISPVKHPVCGLTCNHEEKHEDLTFIIWRYYEKLPDASGNFVLGNDVCLSREMFTVGKKIVLCLNGHTVYRSDNTPAGTMGSMISLWSGSELTICDCQEQCGCITEGVATNGGALKNYATLNIYNGIFTGNSSSEDGGAILNNGVMNFYGGEISGNTASEYGGGIINSSGTLNIYGGVIKENSAQWGGGIVNESGTVNILGGEIQNNAASELGGGVYTYNISRTSSSGTVVYNGSVNISGGEISLNTAPRGAGIYAAAELNISGGEIRQNSGATYGGGIYIDASSNTAVTGGSIIANDAVYGGGIHNEGVINFAGGLISKNTSKYGGAGLRNGEIANITGGTIIDNTAGTVGGGVVSERNTLIYISGTPVIIGNSSANGTDNLYLDPGVVIAVGEMNASANIGITLGNSEIREFTSGGGCYHSLFSSDSTDYAVNISGDNLMLDYSYNVSVSEGDVNSDGTVNMADIIVLCQLVAEGTYNINSDINGDFLTNVSDIVLLTQIIAAG